MPVTDAGAVPEEAAIRATSSSDSSALRLLESGSSLLTRRLVTLPEHVEVEGGEIHGHLVGAHAAEVRVLEGYLPPFESFGERAWWSAIQFTSGFSVSQSWLCRSRTTRFSKKNGSKV